MSQAFEVAAGGGRGSGKSEAGFPLSVRGNADKVRAAIAAGKQPDPVDISYINSPKYRFLVLRKNADDLRDCWNRAKQFYSVFGATFNNSDMVVTFPSGAEGVFDHLATEDAFQKYQGQEFQLLWVEEIGQIASEQLYEKVTLSCRSTVQGLKQKLFVTANPGGKGSSWFKQRFIENTRPGEMRTDPLTGLTRVFIHSTVFDNPYFLRDNPMYVNQLRAIKDEHLRRLWFSGDFDALEGAFFTEFRDKHRPGDPEQALHVVPANSVQLLPHWRRWMAMDWGFSHNASVQWACYAADQRIYVYRESVESRIGTREWGVRVARMSIDDLNGLPDHHLTLFLSPDAFAKRDDENTPAEQIAAGIGDVLGKGAAFVVDLTDEEKTMPAEQAMQSMNARRHRQLHQTSITIERAANHRISGWSLIRDLFRWWPILEQEAKLDPQFARELLATKGVLAYAEYIKRIEAMRSEVLPKLRIFDSCPKLIKGIMSAQHDSGTEDVLKTDGDDEADNFRYLCMGFDGVQNAKPLTAFVSDRIAELPMGMSAHSRAMAATRATEEYSKTSGQWRGLNIPRSTGRHKRGATFVQ